MFITWMNYKAQLGPALWEQFKNLAYAARGRAIIYQGGALRYATIDEQYPTL